MPSTASRGHGTKLRKVSGTNSTLVAQIIDISTEAEVDDIDVSNMDSTNRRREFLPGMVDEGEVSLTLVYAKGQASTLKGLVGADAASFEIELTDRTNTSGTGSVLAFTGYGKGLGFETSYEDKVQNTFTLKISGETTFTPSA